MGGAKNITPSNFQIIFITTILLNSPKYPILENIHESIRKNHLRKITSERWRSSSNIIETKIFPRNSHYFRHSFSMNNRYFCVDCLFQIIFQGLFSYTFDFWQPILYWQRQSMQIQGETVVKVIKNSEKRLPQCMLKKDAIFWKLFSVHDLFFFIDSNIFSKIGFRQFNYIV